jgi:hypothetical protein
MKMNMGAELTEAALIGLRGAIQLLHQELVSRIADEVERQRFATLVDLHAKAMTVSEIYGSPEQRAVAATFFRSALTIVPVDPNGPKFTLKSSFTSQSFVWRDDQGMIRRRHEQLGQDG